MKKGGNKLGKLNIENLATDIPDDPEFTLNRDKGKLPSEVRDSRKVLNLIEKRDSVIQEEILDSKTHKFSVSNDSTSRSLRLIDYLTELARLRSKIVRDLREYRTVLWIHEIPHDQDHCFTQAWGPSEEYYEDVWMEITKYDEPVLDEVPNICKKWVDYSTLYDTENIPDLLSSISIQVDIKNPDANPDDPEEEAFVSVTKTLKLEDYPEVSNAWDKFIETKWFPWTDLHQQWQAVQKVYSKLFSIYQEQQKSGEKYDLVIGLGLLKWKTPSGHTVHRHLLTARADLSFEARLGKFTVTPSPDGAQLSTELDMLDIEDHPFNVRQKMSEGLLSAEDNPWNRSSINPVLKALANSLADQGQGEYHDGNLKSSQRIDTTKPNVDYAPALILRERSSRGLEQTLGVIRDQIKSGGNVPLQFKDLYEEKIDRENYFGENKHIGEDPTIYFPKPSNKEQRQIVEKLQSSSGVLVQGPPGTGKSHTIANLICHLLATNQRVLVTAKTPQALLVLHDKLPNEIQPLCISLLGSGLEEQRSLEASVTGILTEENSWNEKSAHERITILTQSIHQTKSEKAEIEFRIRSIREKDTFEQTIVDGAYQGTAAKIALRLRNESPDFEWLRDNIGYDEKIPVPPADIIKLRAELWNLTPEMDAELQMEVPELEKDLPTQDVFEASLKNFFEIRARLSKKKNLIGSPMANILEKTKAFNVFNIIDSMSQLQAATESVLNRSMPWIEEAVHDMLAGNGTPWAELLTVSAEKLEGLKERARKNDTQTLTIPDSVDKAKLLVDAGILKRHFDKGGKIGRGPFRAKVVRERKYVIEDIQFTSGPCTSSEYLEMLIEYLEVERSIDYAWRIWEGKTERKEGPSCLQVAELEQLQEALQGVANLEEYLKIAKNSLDCIQGLGEPTWHDLEEINSLIETCQAVVLKDHYDKAKEELENHMAKIGSFSNRPNAHPVAKKAFDIIKKGKVGSYLQLLSEITNLHKRSENAKWAKSTLQKLSEVVPVFGEELLNSSENESWEKRLVNIEQAWAWKRANSWLDDFLNEENLTGLERQATWLEDEIAKYTAELVSVKAWKFCLNPMKDSHRRHLMGWQQAINKTGKSTGKHAPKHRRDAQEHLNKCREAIPTWIMPLHRVYETVKPAPGIFDVIIVDEASQCGPEALPLTYLAKRILVVGDEQQISPEGVGIEKGKIFHLREEYLKDFEHADSFDVESSLFDHGKRRFGNKIVLREHFRCMPEIIRFSNDLSYSATPLTPLRQYPSQRLEPLKLVHVSGGYREGRNSRVINRPEAEALVEVVVQCCNDHVYEGKTMGVIVLQGEAQAVLIENMLLEQLGAEEMEQRRLICGNPYSFQGDERHIIFLSMVAAPNERIGPFSKPAHQRRFNVAASRAQDQMWLFHTATRNDLSQTCLRRRLLEYFENPGSQITKTLGEYAAELCIQAQTANRQLEKAPDPFDSWFEVDIALSIASRGFRVIPQYPVINNMRIDLVVEGTKSSLAVECDGDHWHGADQFESDRQRERVLGRCGWRFHRIRQCSFNANPEKALEELWQVLKHQGIRPIAKETPRENITRNHGKGIDLKDSKQATFNFSDADLSDKTESHVPKHKETTEQRLEDFYRPDNIQKALSTKPTQLRNLIIDMLKTLPNNSCRKDAVPKLVLKELQIISRGKPRDEFSRKINNSLRYLESKSIIKTYKSKNVRVKLNRPKAR